MVESWQRDYLPFRFTLMTDAGESYLIRGELFRVHFRGRPIDTWINANTTVPWPEPGERVTAWQPYADRTALVYGVVNPETQHMEISEVYVQDGPCDVTPAMTHCQNWLQILPEAAQSD